jgi:DNA-binding HxlR family transcriptional regulator
MQPCSVDELEAALACLTGRWKLLLVFHLFRSGKPMRFSALERAIPNVTQKMLAQQLRALEEDQVIKRVVFDVVPPRVEYQLTPLGKALEPALAALLQWSRRRARKAQAGAGRGPLRSRNN